MAVGTVDEVIKGRASFANAVGAVVNARQALAMVDLRRITATASGKNNT
ncbi:MAG: hypothetical protein KDJ45_10280 [Hyphomicrobiaceae bacterium]|nr:hypothetical protein [Hyphomicrobiaceae bacterium]